MIGERINQQQNCAVRNAKGSSSNGKEIILERNSHPQEENKTTENENM